MLEYFIKAFVIGGLSVVIFKILYEKTNVHKKILYKFKGKKNNKLVSLICLVILSIFIKWVTNGMYERGNWYTLIYFIINGFLFCTIFKVIPIIVEEDN